MTQEETNRFLSQPVSNFVDGAVQYACGKLDSRKSQVNEMMKTEAGRVLSELFDQYTHETGEEFLASLENQYHVHYRSQIDQLRAEVLQLRQHHPLSTPSLAYHIGRQKIYDAMQMKRDEEFIKSVSTNYINTKEDVLNAFGVPQPTFAESKPVNVVKIEEMENEVTEYKRQRGRTLLENLYPDIYV